MKKYWKCSKCGKEIIKNYNNQKYCEECSKKVMLEKRKALAKKWYEKNRKNKLDYQREYNKKNNYSSEKTEKQRMIRSIKRETRHYFSLIGHNCEFCGNKATEHHHNTFPIEFDKFNYVYHKCHNIIQKGGKNEKIRRTRRRICRR